MSDASGGDGWWLASDGKWYPPEQAADGVPWWPEPERVAEPAPAVQTGPSPQSRSKLWLVAVAVLVVAGLATALVVVLTTDTSDAPVAIDQQVPFQIEEPSQADIDRAERAIDLLGGFSEAVVAVLSAADRGYSADQIFEGVDSGGLQGDGAILAASGETISPDGAQNGLIEHAFGEVELIAFSARAGDLTDEEIDQLSDEELDAEFERVHGTFDHYFADLRLEAQAEALEQAMRDDFADEEDQVAFTVVTLSRVLAAIKDEVSTEELIFVALTGGYSDQTTYRVTLLACSAAAQPGSTGSLLPCVETEQPGLIARMQARQRALTTSAATTDDERAAADTENDQADQADETSAYAFRFIGAFVDGSEVVNADEMEIRVEDGAVVAATGVLDVSNSLPIFEDGDDVPDGSCALRVTFTFTLPTPIPLGEDGRFQGAIDNEAIGTGDCYEDGRIVIPSGSPTLSGRVDPSGDHQLRVEAPFGLTTIYEGLTPIDLVFVERR